MPKRPATRVEFQFPGLNEKQMAIVMLALRQADTLAALGVLIENTITLPPEAKDRDPTI